MTWFPLIAVNLGNTWYYTGIDNHYSYCCTILHVDAFLLEEKQFFAGPLEPFQSDVSWTVGDTSTPMWVCQHKGYCLTCPATAVPAEKVATYGSLASSLFPSPCPNLPGRFYTSNLIRELLTWGFPELSGKMRWVSKALVSKLFKKYLFIATKTSLSVCSWSKQEVSYK